MQAKNVFRGALKSLFKGVLGAWLSSLPRPATNPPIERILVFAYHGLGNFIMFTPALKLLRERYPEARIDLQVGNNTGCEQVLEGAGWFDNVYNLPYSSSAAAWLRRAREIRRTRYDLTINEFHSHSWPLALLVAASAAPFRLGHVTSPGWGPEFSQYSFVFNLRVTMRSDQHEIDRYLDLMAAIGIEKPDYRSAGTSVHLTEKDRDFASDFLRGDGYRETTSVVGFQPGTSATMRWKQWPVERWRSLLDRLVAEAPAARIVLFGSSSEAPMIEKMAEGLGPRVLLAAGKTSIKQAASLIEACDVLVCNDSGLMHVAGAVGTPVVAIYGPTDFSRTAPLGAGNSIIRHELPCSPCFTMEGEERVRACPHHDCLMTISPDEVLVAIKRQIGQSNASAGSTPV
jgi:heptosyltransferase-2